MSSCIKIDGFYCEQFSRVRDAFEENFDKNHEAGAGFSVYWQGKPVVELWGGTRDRAQTLPWHRDTLVNVFSATKGITALCAHRLIEQGLLDLDASVAEYWPEFAAQGKHELSVRMILNHRSGLSAFKQDLAPQAIYEWDTMVSALARERPWWTPGSEQGYQAFTFGWLVGELVRRISGKSVGQYFRNEIGEPLDLDFYIGLAPEQLTRVADVARLESAARPQQGGSAESTVPDLIADTARTDDIAVKAFMNPPTLTIGTNSSAWRQCEIPSANGHGTAKALACIYGGLANGGAINGKRLLREENIKRCYTESSADMDAVLLIPVRFSLGFMLSNTLHKQMRLGRGEHAFGHTGAGGSVGFADPQYGLGFGYVTSRLGSRAWIDPRADALISAVYDAVL